MRKTTASRRAVQWQTWIDAGELPRTRAAIEDCLAIDPQNSEALFYRGACFMRQAQIGEAQADFEQAAELQPKNPRFANACAAIALVQGRFRDALAWTDKALALDASFVPGQLNKAWALLRLRRWFEALPLAEALVTVSPEDSVFLQLMGEVFRGVGRYAEALHCFESIAAVQVHEQPATALDRALCLFHMGDRIAARQLLQPLLEQVDVAPSFHLGLGIQAQACWAPLIALEFFRRGHEIFPRDLSLLVNLGITVQALGNPGEGLFYLQQALEVDPRCEAAWYFSAMSHQALRNRAEAQNCLEECLKIDSKHSQALLMLASMRKDAGKIEEAKQLLRDAISSDPDSLQAYLNLYSFLQESGDLDEAGEVLDSAQLRDLDPEALRQSRASLMLKRGDITGANAIFREILQSEPENPDAMSGLLFCSNYDPELTPEQIAEAYKSWNRRFVSWRAPATDFQYGNKPDPDRRLRVGYIGGDFKTHSVAFFSEPLLANHDHGRFEIFCYANQKTYDATTQRMMAMVDHWRWTQDLSDEALAEMIRLDSIDILIDLSNHTAFHRLYLMGRKPAPIQMTTIGMPTTTGLSAIDWRITDAFMDPPGLTERLHSEKLLRIVSGWCYRPLDEGRDFPIESSPALRNKHLTLASFNAFGKINPKVIRLWGRLLKAIPDAVLVLATGGKEDDKVLTARIKKTCRACGVPLRRVRLMARKPLKEYLLEHNNVDIVLDAFPYTGATVTAHALWMGVPVVTLAGPSPIHRSATSMMSTVGHPEFIAQTQDEYIQIVQKWANNIPGLAALRSVLRQEMQLSPLMDGGAVTKDLEKKLREVWRDWCKNQKMQSKNHRKAKER